MKLDSLYAVRAWFPRYPHIDTDYSVSDEVNFLTEDKADSVYLFYTTRLMEQGFALNIFTNESGLGRIIQAIKVDEDTIEFEMVILNQFGRHTQVVAGF